MSVLSNRISIGVDIENIEKFSNLKNKSVLKKIFTDIEIKYCLGKIHSSQHFAARFAAKEAIMKAFSSVTAIKLSFIDIEIKNETDGKPTVNIKNNFLKNTNILLSLSHNDDTAIAFAVILYRNEEKS